MLADVSANFPDTKDFIKNKLPEVCERESMSVDEVFIVCFLVIFLLLSNLASFLVSFQSSLSFENRKPVLFKDYRI